MLKYLTGFILLCVLLPSCTTEPVQTIALQPLCPNYNPVFIEHHGNDSCMYWIPNCFAPGDSTSPNDSLVEFERNMAQVITTIYDSTVTPAVLMVYDNKTFQTPGFASHTVWYGNSDGLVAPEKKYSLTVTGTTLFGTSLSMKGSVSLLRYFFGNDTVRHSSKILVNCDTCTFNAQWTGTNVNLQLPTNEHFVPDAYYQCN